MQIHTIGWCLCEPFIPVQPTKDTVNQSYIRTLIFLFFFKCVLHAIKEREYWLHLALETDNIKRNRSQAHGWKSTILKILKDCRDSLGQ